MIRYIVLYGSDCSHCELFVVTISGCYIYACCLYNVRNWEIVIYLVGMFLGEVLGLCPFLSIWDVSKDNARFTYVYRNILVWVRMKWGTGFVVRVE